MGIIKTLNRKFLRIKDLSSFKKNLILKEKNIIITGCNSGIGLNLIKKTSNSNNVLAFVNEKYDEAEKVLVNSGKIIKCDFSNLENIIKYQDLITEFNANSIINCAATFGKEENEVENIDLVEYQNVINTNVLSQFALIQYSLKSKSLETIVNISSEMGSSTSNNDGGHYFYRTTKAFLNSISKNLSIDLVNKKINTFCIHPGSVKTRLNSGGLIHPEVAAQKIINICVKNKKNFSGIFIDVDEKILDW